MFSSQKTVLCPKIRFPYTFEYQNNDGLLTAKNEPNGNRFEHFFDETGRVYKTNNQENGEWNFSKEIISEGLITSTTTTPNTTKMVERHSHSTGAEDIKHTTPTGEIITNNTSADGLESKVGSTCGPKIDISQDLDQWFGHTYTATTKLTSPAGLTLSSTLDKNYIDSDNDGLLESVTHSLIINGKTSTVEHNISTSAYTVTSPENRVTTSSYNPLTLQTVNTSIPGFYDVSYDYYTDGKIKSTTSGSRKTSYTYDTNGNIVTVTDPMSRVTRFTDYDAVGRLKRVERADGSALQYDYDKNGNMTMYRTAVPADNIFGYNGVNKRSSFTTPLSSTTSYAYNEERQLTRVTLPSLKEIENIYLSGRLTETRTDEWTNLYEYECGTNVDTITRGTEVIDYDYDGSLVTGVTQSGTLNEILGFEYNNDFQVSSFTYGGATENYIYDKDGLLTDSGIFKITRNIDNGLPESVSDDTFTLTRGFNGYGEVDSVDVNIFGSLFGYNLTRYADGRIETKTETVEGAGNVFAYTYDNLGRLLTVRKDSNLVEEYRYDDNGNRTYQMNSYLNISGRTFSHSIEDHTVTAGNITYEFDYDDNLSARIEGAETTEYVYSSTGELRSVTLPNATQISYMHDPLGRRIAKKIDGTIVEKYLWSGRTTLLAVYDGSDNLLQRFEYADGRMPFAMTAGEEVYYLTYDQVGSLRLVIDSTGSIIKQVDYDTFGNIINDTNESFTIPFGFAGGLHDRDTGLVRFGYRDYLPELGKWTAKDPIDFAAGDSNLYGYVQNDPVNFIDPEGLAGYLTIHSSGRGFISGHSWISYKPDGSKDNTTWGTFGNNPYGKGNGLHEGLEQGMTGDASRTMYLDDDAEQRLKDYIQGVKNKGEDGWAADDNCSSFASGAWNEATGENLDPKNNLGIPTPTALKHEIRKKNGRKNHLTVNNKNAINSSFP